MPQPDFDTRTLMQHTIEAFLDTAPELESAEIRFMAIERDALFDWCTREIVVDGRRYEVVIKRLP